MAAIAGIINGRNSSKTVDTMLRTLKHRGPDLRAFHAKHDFAFGTQASALSPARGNGFARANGLTVLFDGEIYNARRRCESDADVVLRLYLEQGRTFPSSLEGVFACAIFDGDELLLARDPVGVRPLYRGNTLSGSFCFASEMKALVGVSRDVEEILPGTTYSSLHGVAGYVAQSPRVCIPGTPAKAAEALRDCLMRAVERRLADKAVGACLLSGGLDSSIIASAVKELDCDMPLLTVGADEKTPDIENAGIMARHLGMKHEVRLFTAGEIEALLPQAVWNMESFDEDCVSGTISNLFASALAAKTTGCILSGEGADELFGGYHLLKDLATAADRLNMMQRLVDIAYNTALQRLDRAMMANAVNYRTPFLDPEVVAFAAHVPVEWKIRRLDSGELIEKWILREAFKNLLPESICKRIKLRFSRGTGTDDLMDEIASAHVTAHDFTTRNRITPEGYSLHSAKELWYYRLFKRHFPDPCFERLVGRWDPTKKFRAGSR